MRFYLSTLRHLNQRIFYSPRHSRSLVTVLIARDLQSCLLRLFLQQRRIDLTVRSSYSLIHATVYRDASSALETLPEYARRRCIVQVPSCVVAGTRAGNSRELVCWASTGNAEEDGKIDSTRYLENATDRHGEDDGVAAH